jgi:hypothetical protein
MAASCHKQTLLKNQRFSTSYMSAFDPKQTFKIVVIESKIPFSTACFLLFAELFSQEIVFDKDTYISEYFRQKPFAKLQCCPHLRIYYEQATQSTGPQLVVHRIGMGASPGQAEYRNYLGR